MAAAARSRFRIHLSTAIVLMFVASGLLWANISQRARYATNYFDQGELYIASHGWPFGVSYQWIVLGNEEMAQAPLSKFDPQIHWLNIGANTAIALTILFACGCLLEWRIRRRGSQ